VIFLSPEECSEIVPKIRPQSLFLPRPLLFILHNPSFIQPHMGPAWVADSVVRIKEWVEWANKETELRSFLT
jgi:hypothetical protein